MAKPLPADGFVRLSAVLAPEGPIPVGRTMWWAGVKSGRYPKPVKLGPRTTAWRVADIRALIDGGGIVVGPASAIRPYFGSTEIAAGSDVPHQPHAEMTPQEKPKTPPNLDAVMEFASRAIVDRDTAADLAACFNFNGGVSLFYSFNNKMYEALNVSYPAFLRLKSGGEAAIAEVFDHPAFQGRKRRPKKGTEATLAVQLVAWPQNPVEQKATSEYANLLIWAAAHEIAPADFIDRTSRITLKVAKSFVRGLRSEVRSTVAAPPPASSRAEASPDASSAISENQLAPTPSAPFQHRILVTLEGPGPSRTFTRPIDAELFKALLAMPEPEAGDHSPQRLFEILTRAILAHEQRQEGWKNPSSSSSRQNASTGGELPARGRYRRLRLRRLSLRSDD